MANAYYPNNLVRLTAAFTVAGTPTDPTTVAVKVKDPTGLVTTYASPTHDSTGNYHQDVTPVVPGIWYYEWSGVGAVVAEYEQTFTIIPAQSG